MGNRSRKVSAPKQIARNEDCLCGSGKKFKRCHGQDAPPVLAPPQLATPTGGLKLDLGAGQSPRDGFEGVDLWPDSKHVVDLFKFPWPFEDDSCDELHASHFVEHIPARPVEERDLRKRMCPDCGFVQPPNEGEYNHMVKPTECPRRGAVVPIDESKFIGQDMLFAFFDECWRIMKHDALLTVIVPALQSVRAFQDPTHRRFIPPQMFAYLSAEWRKVNKLDHYRVRCNFSGNANPTIPQEFGLLSDEVQSRRLSECWNVMVDIHAKMQAIKTEEKKS